MSQQNKIFKLYKVVTGPQFCPCTMVHIFNKHYEPLANAAMIRNSIDKPQTKGFLLYQPNHEDPLFMYHEGILYNMECLGKQHDPFGPDERYKDDKGEGIIWYHTPQVRYDPQLKKNVWNSVPDSSDVLFYIIASLRRLKLGTS